jgi:hypothetical protein
MSEFAPGKRVKIIFSVWNLAGIEGNFGTILRPGEIYDWIVLVEFPGAQPEEEGCNESILELVEDAPTDTPAPLASTTAGVGRKPTYEELQAENALMAGRIEDLTGELERERDTLKLITQLGNEYMAGNVGAGFTLTTMLKAAREALNKLVKQ